MTDIAAAVVLVGEQPPLTSRNRARGRAHEAIDRVVRNDTTEPQHIASRALDALLAEPGLLLDLAVERGELVERTVSAVGPRRHRFFVAPSPGPDVCRRCGAEATTTPVRSGVCVDCWAGDVVTGEEAEAEAATLKLVQP